MQRIKRVGEENSLIHQCLIFNTPLCLRGHSKKTLPCITSLSPVLLFLPVKDQRERSKRNKKLGYSIILYPEHCYIEAKYGLSALYEVSLNLKAGKILSCLIILTFSWSLSHGWVQLIVFLSLKPASKNYPTSKSQDYLALEEAEQAFLESHWCAPQSVC